MSNKIIDSEKGSVKLIIGVVVFLLIIVLVVMGVFYGKDKSFFKNIATTEDKGSCPLNEYESKVSAELKQGLINFNISSVNLQQKREIVEMITSSEEEATYPILLSLNNCKLDPFLEPTLEKALIKKIEKLGYTFSVKEFSNWLEQAKRRNGKASLHPKFKAITQLFDKQQSIENKKITLGELYAENSSVGFNFTAALALDEKEAEYLTLLKVFAAQAKMKLEFEEHSLEAVLMANAYFSRNYEYQLQVKVADLNDKDLLWILKPLTEYKNSLVNLVVEEIIKRNLLSPLQKAILEPIRSLKGSDASEIKSALIALISSEVDSKNIATIGRWLSPDSEKVLAIAVITLTKEELALYAFDVLTGKTLQNKVLENLYNWAKKSYWQEKNLIYKHICSLSLGTVVSEEEKLKAITALLPYTKNGNFADAIFGAKDEQLMALVLQKYPDIVPVDLLFDLLSNSKKQIRILAVKSLRGLNDVAALQIILKAYHEETDEEVRNVYKENHWVTEKR